MRDRFFSKRIYNGDPNNNTANNDSLIEQIDAEITAKENAISEIKKEFDNMDERFSQATTLAAMKMNLTYNEFLIKRFHNLFEEKQHLYEKLSALIRMPSYDPNVLPFLDNEESPAHTSSLKRKL